MEPLPGVSELDPESCAGDLSRPPRQSRVRLWAGCRCSPRPFLQTSHSSDSSDSTVLWCSHSSEGTLCHVTGATAVYPQCRANAGSHAHWPIGPLAHWSMPPRATYCVPRRQHLGNLRLSSQRANSHRPPVPFPSFFSAAGKTTQPRRPKRFPIPLFFLYPHTDNLLYSPSHLLINHNPS